MDLILRSYNGSYNGDFDLFGSEPIVQTIGIFNLEDISNRPGEYTNVFELPLTNNNIELIGHSNFIPGVNTIVYQRINIDLIIGGIPFKSGLLIIDSIEQTIKTRFISGNSTFYELIKNLYLTDLDWSEYDHLWNLTNAVANSNNTSGFFYPLVDYGGQNLAGDIVDVRKVLPTTFAATAVRKLIEQQGYTKILNFDVTDIEKAVLPYAKKNPEVSAAIQLLSEVDVENTNIYPIIIPVRYQEIWAWYDYDPLNPRGHGTFNAIDNERIKFNNIVTSGTSSQFDFIVQQYTASYAGVYDFDCVAELDDYDCMTASIQPTPIGYYECNTFVAIKAVKITSSGVVSDVSSVVCNTGSRIAPNYTYYSIDTIPQTFITNNLIGSVYLAVGDQLLFTVSCVIQVNGMYIEQYSATVWGTEYTELRYSCVPVIKANPTLKINLQSALVFGGPITYNQMLPHIKCSDFLRDICIRFGLILAINEDDKTVTINKFGRVVDNIPIADDWSDKLDESKSPNIRFAYDSYAQKNHFIHTEDKSITSTPIGSNYTLLIDNKNLQGEKIIYTSPFGVSEIVDFNGTLTATIGLYDITSGKFKNDIAHRICFSDVPLSLFKFTDGTTTSGYINVRRIWFIDDNFPSLSMGFEMGLINKNSLTLVSTLQNLRIITNDFNLNIIDIKAMDFFIPKYISQFQSYFFVSSINQFPYTIPGLTEVELIKLNP